MITLLIATRNGHKVGEIRTILGDRFRYLTLKDFPDSPIVIEDASTFAGNATKKASGLAKWLAGVQAPAFNLQPSSVFVLADDSGLEVDALGGRPGVHSARFAALDSAGHSNSTDAENNAKLLGLLNGVPSENRTARFRCVIAFVGLDPDSAGMLEVFDGCCEGRIDVAPHGQGGFGYDPLFVPEGFTQSFAELGEEVKNRLSHRSQALAKLKKWLTR